MKTRRILSMTWLICTLMIIMVGFSLLLENQALLADENGRIVFTKIGKDKMQIVVTDEDGKNMQILSGNDGPDLYPSWSPNGKHIAFASNRDGDGMRIYIMDSDGSNEYQVTENRVGKEDEISERSPSFSPDGKKLIFTREIGAIWAGVNPKIYTIDIDGRNERYLIDGWTPEWSPDGKKIVFESQNMNGNVVNSNIIIMDTDGNNQEEIVDSSHDPAWSPDGKQIVFSSRRSKNILGNQIYKMDSNGRNIVPLTGDRSNALSPSWSPDGKHMGAATLHESYQTTRFADF